jgi:hypothetical protein
MTSSASASCRRAHCVIDTRARHRLTEEDHGGLEHAAASATLRHRRNARSRRPAIRVAVRGERRILRRQAGGLSTSSSGLQSRPSVAAATVETDDHVQPSVQIRNCTASSALMQAVDVLRDDVVAAALRFESRTLRDAPHSDERLRRSANRRDSAPSTADGRVRRQELAKLDWLTSLPVAALSSR